MLFAQKANPTKSDNLAKEKSKLLGKMKDDLEKVRKSWLKSREGKDYDCFV